MEVWLARGALAELRTGPDAIAAAERGFGGHRTKGRCASPASSSVQESAPTDVKLDGEVERRLDAVARVYREGTEAHPDVAEMHLRLGLVLALLDRHDQADRHLGMAMTLRPDPRQTYLAALFLADLRERQRRPEDRGGRLRRRAQAWPGAQAPVVALARLRVLHGAADAGRATLAGLHVERDMRASDRTPGWVTSGDRAGACPAGSPIFSAPSSPCDDPAARARPRASHARASVPHRGERRPDRGAPPR